MPPSLLQKLLIAGLALVALWLGVRYVLPVLLPFLLGGILALSAEPAVGFFVRKLRLPRPVASGLGISLTLTFLVALISFLAAVSVRFLGRIAGAVPDLEKGALALQDTMIAVAERAPESVRPLAQKAVLELFDGSSAWMQQVTRHVPDMLTSLVSGLGSSFLGIGTFLLSGYLISARLPVWKEKLSVVLPEQWRKNYLPALKKFRSSLWGWVKAQGKLALVTWGIVTVGFFVLQVPYGLLWAALVALVDAVPILGTGVVLLPWAAVCFLQGDGAGALLLLCTYGVCAVTRATLEPRLVGRQLGLDPLSTLVALYAGFRFWGIPGLLLTPIIASAAKSLLRAKE